MFRKKLGFQYADTSINRTIAQLKQHINLDLTIKANGTNRLPESGEQ
ncbi:MAG: hypothetical protein FWF18_00945 [Dehalococcoidia bacterium]|nr:hypothetical protein [Dehalococcoidia bacterium]